LFWKVDPALTTPAQVNCCPIEVLHFTAWMLPLKSLSTHSAAAYRETGLS
jgi:hypothetical protein